MAEDLFTAVSATRDFFDPDGKYSIFTITVTSLPAHDIAEDVNGINESKFARPSYIKSDDDQWAESQL